jgi:hypothetical protein
MTLDASSDVRSFFFSPYEGRSIGSAPLTFLFLLPYNDGMEALFAAFIGGFALGVIVGVAVVILWLNR